SRTTVRLPSLTLIRACDTIARMAGRTVAARHGGLCRTRWDCIRLTADASECKDPVGSALISAPNRPTTSDDLDNQRGERPRFDFGVRKSDVERIKETENRGSCHHPAWCIPIADGRRLRFTADA